MGKNETQGSVIQVDTIMEKKTFTLSVHSIRYEGASTRLFELRPPAGTYLPPVEAGAHIDVHISPTITRQYSLCNTPGETHRYIIGVALDPCSRGGSRALHEVIKLKGASPKISTLKRKQLKEYIIIKVLKECQ